MAKDTTGFIGSWAFLLGVLLAVVFGLFSSQFGDTGSLYVTWILIVFGLIIGLLNVTSKESGHFLMSGAVLLIASMFGAGILQEVKYLPNILQAILVIFVPATIIVAIKNVFSLAKN